nr:hypothetical protein [Tanacetum cinerariifolium]
MDGAVHTYKACLVAKGFTQTPGIDYEETFSPVADIGAIRILIAIAAFYDYEIWQIDVKTAFLNGYLNEEVYMEQSKDLEEAAYILGIKIYRDRSKRLIGFCPSAYIEKILGRFYMENSKCGTIPMQEKLKFSKSQGDAHWTAVKNILKYLRNTKVMFLVYGGAVDWKSTKQSIFATSSTDVEYIAVVDAPKEAGAIAISKDHEVTKGARHFCAKVHYLGETIEMGDVRIEKVHTYDKLANQFTKVLAFPKHSELTEKIEMILASSLM